MFFNCLQSCITQWHLFQLERLEWWLNMQSSITHAHVAFHGACFSVTSHIFKNLFLSLVIYLWIYRFFIGTSVSTFSFRIHEEREILGFDPKTTYNRFCGDTEKECEQPTHWKIVYWWDSLTFLTHISAKNSVKSDIYLYGLGTLLLIVCFLLFLSCAIWSVVMTMTET